MQGVQIPAFEQGLHIETKWWSATKQKGKAYWVSINLFQIVIWILNLQVESSFFWQARVLVSTTRTCRGVSLSTWHQVTSRKFGFHSVTGSGHGGQVPEDTEGKNFEDLRRRIPSYGFGIMKWVYNLFQIHISRWGPWYCCTQSSAERRSRPRICRGVGCPVKHGTVSTLKLCLHNITEGGHGDVPQDSEGENFKKLFWEQTIWKQVLLRDNRCCAKSVEYAGREAGDGGNHTMQWWTCWHRQYD